MPHIAHTALPTQRTSIAAAFSPGNLALLPRNADSGDAFPFRPSLATGDIISFLLVPRARRQSAQKKFLNHAVGHAAGGGDESVLEHHSRPAI